MNGAEATDLEEVLKEYNGCYISSMYRKYFEHFLFFIKYQKKLLKNNEV